MKARDWSLVAKIIAMLVLIIAHFLLWVGKLPHATSYEIIICSLTILGIFGTIDLNLIIEKFTRRG